MADIMAPQAPDAPSTLDTDTAQVGQEPVNWKDPSSIRIDFTPPPEGTPPPSPRVRQSGVFDKFSSLHPRYSMTSAKNSKPKTANGASCQDQNMAPPGSKRTVVSRPACTHISMVKIYFDRNNPIRCYQCNRVPSIGFIYCCEQDKTHPPPQLTEYQSLNAMAFDKNAKKSKKPGSGKDKRRPCDDSIILDMSCLSPGILNNIKNGHYTPEQIDKLILQKTHLLKTFAQVQAEASDDYRCKSGSTANIFNQKLSQIDEDDSTKDAGAGKPAKMFKTSQKQRRASIGKSVALCDHKVCHTCRPNSREKSFMSLDAVCHGEVAPITEWCPQSMPVIPLNLASNLGLREVPEYLRTVESSSTISSDAMSSSMPTPPDSPRPTTWSPNGYQRQTDSVESFRTGLRKSLLDMLRMRLGSPSPASAPPSVSTVSSSPRDSAYQSTVSTPKSEGGSEFTALTVPTAEQTEIITNQINTLSDFCTTETGEFNVALWRQMSDEVLAKAAALQLSDPPVTSPRDTTYHQDLHNTPSPMPTEESLAAFQPPLAQSEEAENDGDLGTADIAKLKKEHDIQVLEEKLKALKESASDEEAESGLHFGRRFGGLGLRLTEEAAETNSPDMIVSG